MQYANRPRRTQGYLSQEPSVHMDGAMKRSLEIGRMRLILLCCFFTFCYLAIDVRLVDLSLDGRNKERREMNNISTNTEVVLNRRSIVDRNGVLLATNLKTVSLYANPKIIMNAKEVARQLAAVLPEISYASLLEKLTGERSFVWIKRHLNPAEQQAILNMGQPGLDFRDDERRVYPHGNMVAHVMGMVGLDGHGLAGVERYFDKDLQNTSDEDDGPIQLSLDMRVQNVLHEELMKRYLKHSCIGASGIVMDAQTGEIIAMVSLPDFDPNQPNKMTPDSQFNRATLGVYEMGSTFKSFTSAMALDSGQVTLSDTFDASEPIKIGRFHISDYHPQHRALTVPEIFMYSSNIGTARMADALGGQMQQAFLKKVGLLDELKVELPEVSKPLLPRTWSRLTTMTVSYGHGIAVTPLHVVKAEASLVNGGVLIKPTLLKLEGRATGERVIKEKTSETMRRLLRLVVANKEGTGKAADVPGYLVGGKTGTAEKVGIGRYDHKRLVTSFVGGFPMTHPRYIVLAVLDEPKGIKETYGFATAGWTAAPVVHDVVSRIGPMLGIKPIDGNSKAVQSMMYVEVNAKSHSVAAN